jgi:hypothetical protein
LISTDVAFRSDVVTTPFMMEEAAEAERHKASRPYDGMAQFSEPHKVMATQLLTTAATLERGYQAFIGCGNLTFFQPQLDELNGLYRQWLVDLEKFKASLRAFGADPKMLAYVNEHLARSPNASKNWQG